MEFDKVIDERQSVRKFKTRKKPRWQDIIEAIDCARRAPLAGNIPSLKFILVDDAKVIAKLAEASQQDFVADAHYVVAVCSEPTDTIRSYDKRGEWYAVQQAGSAIENFLLKIVDMGLASCWVGAFADDQVKVALKVPERARVEALLPVGYAMQSGKQKRKPALDRCLFFNKWGGKFMKPKKTPEAF